MQARSTPLPVIALAWAFCGAIHILTFPWISFATWEGIAYTVAVAVLLAKPASFARYAAFLAATATLLALHYGKLANHLVLEFWIALSILAIFCVEAPRIKSGTCRGAAAYPNIAAIARCQYLFLFLFAAFSKLNTDFLNPEVSCAVLFTNRIINTFHLPFPESALTGKIAIYLALAAELAIPALLLFARTRKLGLLTALVFHFVMGLVPILGISSFSALSFTLLLFFLPPEAFAKLDKSLSSLASRLHVLPLRQSLRFSLITVLLVGVTLLHRHFQHPYVWITNSVWIAIYVPYAWLLAASLLNNKPSPDAATSLLLPQTRKYLLLCVPVIVIGLLPYIGLQTQGSFTMFSNLRLLGTQANHLLAKPDWQIANPELVNIIGTNHPQLSSYPDSNFLIADHELRRISAQYSQDFYILCEYENQIQLIGRFQGELTEHPLLEPLPNNFQRLRRYRDVSASEHCECSW